MQESHKFTIPKQAVLDPVQIRAGQVEEEERKRFQKIADQIIEILCKENILASEYSIAMKYVAETINKKIDTSTLTKIIKE